jgi:transposase
MEHYAGIDVALEQSSVCVVDGTGRIVREAKVASEPEALSRFLGQLGLVVTRIGLEAGPLSQWLHAGLTKAGLEVVLLETRQVKAALSAMVVKTDRKDARGIAQLLRMGWFRPVHCKSPPAQEVRALLVGRKLLQAKLLDVELSIRGILRGFGLKVGAVSKGRFAGRIRELVTGQAMLERVILPMLRAREAPACRVPRAAPGHAGHRARGRDLPSADDGAGGRRSGRDHVRLGDRRPGPVCALPSAGRSLRPHAEEVPVRRDRRHRRDQQGGGRHGPERPL